MTQSIARALVLLLTLAQSPAAFAHATLLHPEPAAGTVVAQAPAVIKLVFNEPVTPLAIQLVGPQGHAVTLTQITSDNATLAIAPPANLPRGTHFVSWRVVSADGHPVGGSFVFSIGERSPGGPSQPQLTADAQAQYALWAAKVALYIGLFFGIGGAFHRAWIASSPSARLHPILIAALGAGLIAALLSIGLQGLDALAAPLARFWEGSVWAAGLATSYRNTVLLAAAALIAALASGFIGASPPARALTLSALLGAGAALAASGHASAAEPQFVTRSAVWLHALCVAIWAGTLVPLALALRGTYESRVTALEIFGRTIPLVVLLLAGTGITLAAIQLQTPEALWTTEYGWVLTRKLVAIFGLLGFVAINRLVFTPATLGGDERAPRRLFYSTLAEIAIVLAILGLVASWRFTPPPRALQAAAEEPIFMHFHTEQAMAEFTIEPVRGGRRQIALKLLNGEFGPLDAKEVTFVLSKPDAGIEPLRIEATRTGDVTWRIADVEVPIPGRWRARFEILVSDFEKVSIEDDVEIPR